MVAPNTLWAVGEQTTCRYDGTSWVRVAPAGTATLLDVVGVSPTLVWAVGQRTTCPPGWGCVGTSVLQRWDGTRWTNATHPLFTALRGVDALAGGPTWAVGAAYDARGIRQTWTIRR